MNTIQTFLEGFCCVIPCPIGLILFAIPPFVLTLRRRKAANAAKQFSQEVFPNSVYEA